jgi:class 3 adenylate cyclase
MTERQEIEQAIIGLEAQRALLGNAVVETSMAALRKQLAELDRSETLPLALKGERKQVTVMFADISGFTAMSEKLDPEEVRSMINACFEGLGAVIDQYGGHIDKFIGDEIMALFGAPAAHENDPERALRAALDMMTALAAFNAEHAARIPKPLALHFGINSGLAIAGGIGTRQRQDYSVMGDTVNLAARLEDLSEAGEILVGEDTYRLTAPLFEFEAIKPVMLKGKEKPVKVYRLLKAKAAPGRLRGIEGLSSPMVGRERELALALETLGNFQKGQGGVITVIGDAGLGKSRLISELSDRCCQNGQADWAEGRALSYGENARYLIVRDLPRKPHLGKWGRPSGSSLSGFLPLRPPTFTPIWPICWTYRWTRSRPSASNMWRARCCTSAFCSPPSSIFQPGRDASRWCWSGKICIGATRRA